MRGDPPTASLATSTPCSSTPHARGSTSPCRSCLRTISVYPACAGIHPFPGPYLGYKPRLPRMRGDPPCQKDTHGKVILSTPHARGSTCRPYSTALLGPVYPACAGIHPVEGRDIREFISLPRMRGDPPYNTGNNPLGIESTPHARGSTQLANPHPGVDQVYPACAGIHPNADGGGSGKTSLPRMRGDPP